MNKRALLQSLVICAATLGVGTAIARAEPKEMSVRVLYVVPSDRERNHEYEQAIHNTALALQMWYYCHLGGTTFRLNDPIVEVRRSSKHSRWFIENPVAHGQERRWDAWHNAFSELAELEEDRKGDRYIWLVFVDAPGEQGGHGASRTAVHFESNLESLVRPYPPENPEPKEFWIGVVGHELGHAFGLPHPPEGTDVGGIMDNGFRKYPTCYLTRDDEAKLLASPFFFAGRSGTQFHSEVMPYAGGCFVKVSDKKWYELKSGSTTVYWFDTEDRLDANFLYIRDHSRRISVALPKRGSECFFAYDGAQGYTKLYDIRN